MQNETTMRYDPEQDAVWVRPDPDSHYLVTRATIEKLMDGEQLAEDELIEVCRDYEEIFTDTAERKRRRDQVEAGGHIVITGADIHTCP